jgi:glycosyltransferase involved in cell wall biosynthesis
VTPLRNRSTPGHIAVVDAASAGWTAGGVFSRTLIKALVAGGGTDDRQLTFITSGINHGDDEIEASGVRVLRTAPPRSRLNVQTSTSTPERRIRRGLGLPDAGDPIAIARTSGAEAVLPLMAIPRSSGLPAPIGWIPDFQHRGLPQHFSAGEREVRDRTYAKLATRARLVLLSSTTMAVEFAQLYPNYANKARIASFPSQLAFRTLEPDALSAIRKYGLPDRFALVANQFWTHKNHDVVVAAVARLRDDGLQIPVVMTGLPADYRDPTNATLSRLLQAISENRLAGQVVVLGEVPYEDLVSLLRTASVIIQPSRYEGWSTTVEDAKALGRPIVCSDIAVHREQAADSGAEFFPVDSAADLAAAMARHWQAGTPRSFEGERNAVARALHRAVTYGRRMMEICDEAASMT